MSSSSLPIHSVVEGDPDDELSDASRAKQSPKSAEKYQQNLGVQNEEPADSNYSEYVCNNYEGSLSLSDWLRTDADVSRSTSEDSADAAIKPRSETERCKNPPVDAKYDEARTNGRLTGISCSIPTPSTSIDGTRTTSENSCSFSAQQPKIAGEIPIPKDVSLQEKGDAPVVCADLGANQQSERSSASVPADDMKMLSAIPDHILFEKKGSAQLASELGGECKQSSLSHVVPKGNVTVSSTRVKMGRKRLRTTVSARHRSTGKRRESSSASAGMHEKFCEARKYSHLCQKLSMLPKVKLHKLNSFRIKKQSGHTLPHKEENSVFLQKYSMKPHVLPPVKPVVKIQAYVPVKRSSSTSSSTSKGCTASVNTPQTPQVVIVHPKAPAFIAESSVADAKPAVEPPALYLELLDELRKEVPNFDSIPPGSLQHPIEPEMPLEAYCTCGMTGSEYATRYCLSGDESTTKEANNITRVVINGFMFLAFFREDKLYLSYGELRQMQVVERTENATTFFDLLKRYPPLATGEKCVDIISCEEFRYLKVRYGALSSLGLMSLGVFWTLVQEGQIHWKVFENPVFAGLPLGHLCPKTTRDFFMETHSILNLEKITRIPARCQADYQMHVGQICFLQSPVWVFECSTLVFINWNQFFQVHGLSQSVCQTASTLLQRLGILLVDAPQAICDAILPQDFDPRKPLSRCSPWIRLRSLGQVLTELSNHASVVASSTDQSLVHQMSCLILASRTVDILWLSEVSFENGTVLKCL